MVHVLVIDRQIQCINRKCTYRKQSFFLHALQPASPILVSRPRPVSMFPGPTLSLFPGPAQFPSLPVSSLVPRPHPAHARRRGLVSQVEILGPAPKAWSGQSNHRAAFIGIMRKQEQVLQSYHSK